VRVQNDVGEAVRLGEHKDRRVEKLTRAAPRRSGEGELEPARPVRRQRLAGAAVAPENNIRATSLDGERVRRDAALVQDLEDLGGACSKVVAVVLRAVFACIDERAGDQDEVARAVVLRPVPVRVMLALEGGFVPFAASVAVLWTAVVGA
jgi:hypothetical protein